VPSMALAGLRAALPEIATLQADRPRDLLASTVRLARLRAVNRACVVLLSSHLEHYIHAVNEEAIDFVNAAGIPSTQIPLRLRLINLRDPIEEAASKDWPARAENLTKLAEVEISLWRSDGMSGSLDASRMLQWMKSPKPDKIRRFYAMWDIGDIFLAVTRTPRTLGTLRRDLDTLVSKRNNIAHGDVNEQATPKDIARYLEAVRTFCSRGSEDGAPPASAMRRAGARLVVIRDFGWAADLTRQIDISALS
jgi:hypothetical protein